MSVHKGSITFKKEFETLKKKNSFKNSLDQDFINCFLSGSKLNSIGGSVLNAANPTIKHLKKRISDHKGPRVYYGFLETKNTILFWGIHAKPNVKGGVNSFSAKEISAKINDLASAIKNKTLHYFVNKSSDSKTVIFIQTGESSKK